MGWRCGRRIRLCILGPSRDEPCDDYRRRSLDQMTTLTVLHQCRIPHAAEACEVNGLALPSVRAPNNASLQPTTWADSAGVGSSYRLTYCKP